MIEVFDETGAPFSIPDDGYTGKYFALPETPHDEWEDEQFGRESHIDWVATSYALHMYPANLSHLPGMNLARMAVHSQLFTWFSQHPTDIELRNAGNHQQEQAPDQS